MPTLPAPDLTAASRIGDADELALLRAVLDAVDEAVLVTASDLDLPGPVIEYANPAVARMTGYTPDELLGQSPRLLQGPNTDRTTLDRMRADLAATGCFHGEAINYRKDGTKYVVEWLITPLRDDQGRVVHWVSVQQDVTASRQLEHQRADLIGELDHRVNNALGTVQSIASLSLRSASSLELFREGFGGRLMALSQAHHQLSLSKGEGVFLHDLIGQAVRPCCGDHLDRCTVSGPEVRLPSSAVVPLTITFHELATNAARHGALSVGDGHLHVTWELSDTSAGSRLTIAWLERGGPSVSAPQRQGFGKRFIEGGLAHELGGTVRLCFDPDGAHCSIDLLLPATLHPAVATASGM